MPVEREDQFHNFQCDMHDRALKLVSKILNSSFHFTWHYVFGQVILAFGILGFFLVKGTLLSVGCWIGIDDANKGSRLGGDGRQARIYSLSLIGAEVPIGQDLELIQFFIAGE